MKDLDSLLARLARWTLVGGKGGVGKTTCAAALALRSAALGQRTLLLSTDPARSLGEAIQRELSDRPRPVRGQPGLHACQLDASAAREAFLSRWRETLVDIVDRGTYLDRDDITGLIDAALPGADESMALLTLAELEVDERWSRVVVDTAPTGHTLRLLALPDTFRALVELLEAMQGKHRFVVSALTHRYRTDQADAFLDEMRRRLGALRLTLTGGSGAAMLLVTRPEPVVVAETARYLSALEGLGLTTSALVINAVPAMLGESERDALRALASLNGSRERYHVPTLDPPPIGLDGIARWGAAVRRGAPPEVEDSTAPRTHRHRRPSGARKVSPALRDRTSTRLTKAGVHPPDASLRARSLTIVGGKGGVGKTTVACALAIASASDATPTLVVSTDPAPSIADALDQPVGDAEVQVEGVPGLCARQMDADAAFAALRDAYARRVDATFDGLMGGSLDAAHDRAIMRDLLALAPPGIDELYALALLGETLSASRFATLIVDPAPTGHLLRLLEMPALALEWTHRLLRLLLKYKEVTGLGESAQELLTFARRTRLVADLLRDPASSGLLVVALDEPLVRAETTRLVGVVRGYSVDVIAILWNRVSGPVMPLPVAPPIAQFESPALTPPPRGVDALRRWYFEWYALPDVHG